MSDTSSFQGKGFKRINFFKGFLTTEEDWNAAESYHIDKRRLHNQLCHPPGVVRGVRSDLRVVARARGDLSVEVQAGYAIDGAGRDLFVPDAVIKNINPEEYRLPQTLYVVLRYVEELTDFIAYKENLEYKGHRRVLESARVELAQTEPDPSREIELARIYLEKGATRVRDARNPADPRANEIDMRFVPYAGVAGSRLLPALRRRLDAVLWQLRSVFQLYARHGIFTGSGVVQGANTALMFQAANQLDLTNVFDVFYLLVEEQGEVCSDVDVNHQNIAQKKEFADYKRHVEILRGLLAEGKNNLEAFTNLMAYQSKASEVAETAIGGPKPRVEEAQEPAARVADINDWEGVKAMPNPQPRMELEGIPWVVVDELDVLDRDSEDKHEFAIRDAKDSYRTRQKLKYPGGEVVEDIGRAQVGGYMTFKISNLTPGKPVTILRRMDYVYGDYELEYFINNKSVAMTSCVGIDRIHRWRNWPVMIDAEHVTESSIVVKQVCLTAGRDVNMFHIWVYQTE